MFLIAPFERYKRPVKHNSHTPIYSPASLERQHSDLKSSLRATLVAMGDQYQTSWMRVLPWIILSRRTSLHGELGTTPATAVFGEDPTLPGDIIPPMGAGETLEEMLARVKTNVDRRQRKQPNTGLFLPTCHQQPKRPPMPIRNAQKRHL